MSNNRTQPIAGPSRSSPTRGYPRAIFDEFQSYPFTDDPDFKVHSLSIGVNMSLC